MNRNKKIYPFYRMFGYDYLFYLVISFLFFTVTKGITIAEVMYLAAFSAGAVAILQIPTNYIVEKIGIKNSMILGNLMWIIHILVMIFTNNFIIFIIGEAIAAFGSTLKSLSETQMLYETLKKTNERKLFSKLEGKGVSWYYYFEALTSLFVGSLFQINNYIPIILTLSFAIIAFVTSLFFDDIEIEKDSKTKTTVKNYLSGFKLVLKSKRIISIFLFSFLMSGLIRVLDTVQKSTIVSLNVTAIEYSLIFAILTLFVGIGSSVQYKMEHIFKRKMLTFVGYTYTILIFLLGLINILIEDKNIALLISIAILIIQNLISGEYRISVKKYLNNFSTHVVRGKILSVFYIFENTGKALLLFVCGRILDTNGTNNTAIMLGIFSFVLMIIILNYMKNRLGLNAEEYTTDDIFGVDIQTESK